MGETERGGENGIQRENHNEETGGRRRDERSDTRSENNTTKGHVHGCRAAHSQHAAASYLGLKVSGVSVQRAYDFFSVLQGDRCSTDNSAVRVHVLRNTRRGFG